METILNVLPLTSEERAVFSAAAPDAEQIFLPNPRLGTAQNISLDKIARATVILGNVMPRTLSTNLRLKWIQTSTAGVDNYLTPGLLPEHTVVTSAAGAYGPSVAEHMFACLFSLMKRLPQYRDQQRAHIWRDLGPVQTLQGATVLLLGVGDIGSRFACMVRAFGARTVGLSRHPDRPVDGLDESWSLADLSAWLPRADVVANSLPSAPETYHILAADQFALMKPTAILLNAGRGPTVDGFALTRALLKEQLAGAALDVTDPEPLSPNDPLWDCPDLLLTPHVAGGDHLPTTIQAVVSIALDNLRRYVSGQPLRNQMR